MQSCFTQPSTMFLSSHTNTHTCVVKVVGALDLRAALGDGLGGLEVGHLHLHRLAQRAARADDDVARLQVQVDLVTEESDGWICQYHRYVNMSMSVRDGRRSHSGPKLRLGQKIVCRDFIDVEPAKTNCSYPTPLDKTSYAYDFISQGGDSIPFFGTSFGTSF